MNRGVLLLKAAIGVVGLSLVGVGGYNLISTGCPLGSCASDTTAVTAVAADAEDCPLGCEGDTATTKLVAADGKDCDPADCEGKTDCDPADCEGKSDCEGAKTTLVAADGEDCSSKCSAEEKAECDSANVKTVAAGLDCSQKCSSQQIAQCAELGEDCAGTKTVAAEAKSDCCDKSNATVQTVAADGESGCSTSKTSCSGTQTVAAESKCSGEAPKDCTADASDCEEKAKLILAEGGELPDCCKAKLEQAKADNADETGEG